MNTNFDDLDSNLDSDGLTEQERAIQRQQEREQGQQESDDEITWKGWSKLEKEVLESSAEFKGKYDHLLGGIAKLSADRWMEVMFDGLSEGKIDQGELATSIKNLLRGCMSTLAYGIAKRRAFAAKRRNAQGKDNVTPDKVNPFGLRQSLAELYDKRLEWTGQPEEEMAVTGNVTLKESNPAQLMVAWLKISAILEPLWIRLSKGAGLFVPEDETISFALNGEPKWLASPTAASLINEALESSKDLLLPNECWVNVHFETLVTIFAESTERRVPTSSANSVTTADSLSFLAQFVAKA
jgi:hypothetical protein